eukprot:TRINITY_DN75_c0_g1_i4.p1 TRINITY_DN75_c0_g1~~TRINITY_DN75_c0_g1_i4.p1  ORF type:complete len:375 (-),score=131.31 TRINITY_DN75_c0_g1_i4:51-1175(-)
MSKALLGVLCLTFVLSISGQALQYQGGYDHDLAVHLLYYVGLVRCGIEMIASWTCPDCRPDIHKRLAYETDELAATQVLITDNRRNEIIVSFRGTEHNVWQWLNNGEVKPVPFFPETCPGCMVHSGLYDRFLDVRDIILDDLNKAIVELPNANIYFTGHSAGGVWAILLAAHIALTNPTLMPTAIYTFGTPRIGNDAFAEFFSPIFGDSFVRVIRPKDPFPYMPTSAKSLGSEVLGTLKSLMGKSSDSDPFYHHFGVLAVCPGEDAPCQVYPRDSENPLTRMPTGVDQHSTYIGQQLAVRYGPGKPGCGGEAKGWDQKLGLDYIGGSIAEKVEDKVDTVKDVAADVKDGAKSLWSDFKSWFVEEEAEEAMLDDA